jgi:hypothetical protein
MASPARNRWIIAGILLVSITIVWWVRRKSPQYPVAYIADRSATLWSTTAQVRQPVATMGYGQRVAVIRKVGDEAEVRTDDGARGWLDARMLMDAAMWQQVADLLTRAKSMTVQAVGHTRALSNLHLQPGRDAPRVFQFGRDVPVAVLERKVLPVPQTGAEAAAEDAGGPDQDKPKQEDWLLVMRARPENSSGSSAASAAGADTPIAGWMLGRFVTLDPPQPIPDYTSSAAMRTVAWAVLNTVPGDGGAKPQYLVAGTRAGDALTCDFTMLRVFTWSTQRHRYETAYIEGNLCGMLPIAVAQTSGGPEFHFAEMGNGGVQRTYRMRQTSVRLVKAAELGRSNSGRR